MNKRHFTLVEVLVVVGIISVLAGLVIPAVGMARQAGRRTECISNQGQLMKLLTITMTANDNYLVSGDDGSASKPFWTRYLYKKDKLQDLKGYRCPSLQTEQPSSLNGLTDTALTSALSAALGVMCSNSTASGKTEAGFDFRGTKLLKDSGNSIAPNQLVLGGCSAVVSNTAITPRADMFGKNDNGRFALVHGDEFNMFFLDGHVASVTKEQAVEHKYRPNATGAGATLIDEENDLKTID